MVRRGWGVLGVCPPREPALRVRVERDVRLDKWFISGDKVADSGRL